MGWESIYWVCRQKEEIDILPIDLFYKFHSGSQTRRLLSLQIHSPSWIMAWLLGFPFAPVLVETPDFISVNGQNANSSSPMCEQDTKTHRHTHIPSGPLKQNWLLTDPSPQVLFLPFFQFPLFILFAKCKIFFEY